MLANIVEKHVASDIQLGDVHTPVSSSTSSEIDPESNSDLPAKPFLLRILTDYSVDDETWVSVKF